ncbi:hypothetical protein PC9H_001776 [Pleurotus ostreatus]|uniref:Uncharacterized protein n=1 Tax=Pleurotus ostreatus TaxID=5322 RepID=A0A8H6ZP38_PLEOS|nr:uncharacterized protein PC9H_001776 [Pleurotus ostreatus]KAF7419190.1 hypothetical protein PC9H_001776 [Pleurotus ostreatus]
MSMFSSILCCCTRARRDSLDSVDERTSLIPHQDIDARVDAQPDDEVVDQQRLRDKWAAVVREKEGKLINVSHPLPFNFHNRALPAMYGPSSSRSASTSTNRYSSMEPGPSNDAILTPSPVHHLAGAFSESTADVSQTVGPDGIEIDVDGDRGRVLQAHIRNPILGIRLVHPSGTAPDVKGKHVEVQRGRERVAWGQTEAAGRTLEQESSSHVDGGHSDSESDADMTPRPSRLITSPRIPPPPVGADLNLDVGKICVSWSD